MIARQIFMDSEKALDDLFLRSFSGPVTLVKHSNRCGISSHILYQLTQIDAEINVLVVQENRLLSNLVATRTGYGHQSPQAFVLRDGGVVYHATHYGIDAEKIAAHMASTSAS